MKKIIMLLTCFAAALSQAALVVDFNAQTQVSTGTLFSTSFAGTNLNLSAADYSGAAMFGAYNENGGISYRVETDTALGASVRTGTGTSSGMFAWDTGGGAVFGVANDTIKANLSLMDSRVVTADFRFVVENAGSWYISETIATASDAAISANALSLAWSAYDVSTIAGVTNMGGASFDPVNFTDIGYAGAYLSVTGNRAGNHGIKSLTVDAIPEPATLGLIAAMGGGLLFIRRRFMM
jgi:hypothetical protein